MSTEYEAYASKKKQQLASGRSPFPHSAHARFGFHSHLSAPIMVRKTDSKVRLEQAALIACSAHTIISASPLGESPIVVTTSKQKSSSSSVCATSVIVV